MTIASISKSIVYEAIFSGFYENNKKKENEITNALKKLDSLVNTLSKSIELPEISAIVQPILQKQLHYLQKMHVKKIMLVNPLEDYQKLINEAIKAGINACHTYNKSFILKDLDSEIKPFCYYPLDRFCMVQIKKLQEPAANHNLSLPEDQLDTDIHLLEQKASLYAFINKTAKKDQAIQEIAQALMYCS